MLFDGLEDFANKIMGVCGIRAYSIWKTGILEVDKSRHSSHNLISSKIR
jgi:hypothetical protein